MSLLVVVSSLVGTVALLLGANIIAYVCGAVGLLDTIRKVAIGEESDKPFWMSIITVVVLAIKPNFTWWQALLIVFLVKTLIFGIIFYLENYYNKIKQYEEVPLYLKIRLILDTLTIVIAVIGTISVFLGINIIAYIGGSLVILNIIFQASEGNIDSLSILWIAIMIGISGILSADTSWISITLISVCSIRTVMSIWRYLKYMLFARNSLRES